MTSPLLPHRLTGAGAPPIVLLNGGSAPMDSWGRVTGELARLSTVLAYNRRLPQTPRAALPPLAHHYVEQLRGLVAALDLRPPLLLVGHSMGGLYADLYARLHPAEVAGVVMVDASHPEQERRFAPRMNGFGRAFRGVFAGLDRLFGPGPLTEVARFSAIGDEIAAAPAFPDIPLTVITATRTPPRWLISSELWDMHLENQRELARLSPQGRQVLASQSDHYVPQRQPELIVDCVGQMLARIRKGPGDRPGP